MTTSQVTKMIDTLFAALEGDNETKRQSALRLLKSLVCFAPGKGAEDAERTVQFILDRDTKHLVLRQLADWARQNEDEHLKACAAMVLSVKCYRDKQADKASRRGGKVVVLYVGKSGRIRHATKVRSATN